MYIDVCEGRTGIGIPGILRISWLNPVVPRLVPRIATIIPLQVWRGSVWASIVSRVGLPGRVADGRRIVRSVDRDVEVALPHVAGRGTIAGREHWRSSRVLAAVRRGHLGPREAWLIRVGGPDTAVIRRERRSVLWIGPAVRLGISLTGAVAIAVAVTLGVTVTVAFPVTIAFTVAVGQKSPVVRGSTVWRVDLHPIVHGHSVYLHSVHGHSLRHSFRHPVGHSVRHSIRHSIRDPVRHSVRHPIWHPVWHPVRHALTSGRGQSSIGSVGRVSVTAWSDPRSTGLLERGGVDVVPWQRVRKCRAEHGEIGLGRHYLWCLSWPALATNVQKTRASPRSWPAEDVSFGGEQQEPGLELTVVRLRYALTQ